jgi:hypothetical protein
MSVPRINYKGFSLWAAVVLLGVGAWSQSVPLNLQYKARGDRSEGVIQPKKSGDAIELISAMTDYQEVSSTMPASLAVRFYLKELTNAAVSVRGIRVAQDYWMNNVQPPKNWERGFNNEFRWPTSTVIQQLGMIRNMYDLGVVVCLGPNCETTDDLVVTVAPAILYTSRLPSSISGYRFTFKPITHESLSFNLYQDVNGDAIGSPLESQVYSDVDPGIPFNVALNAPTREGWYQLQVSGTKMYSDELVSKVIRFYNARVVTK